MENPHVLMFGQGENCLDLVILSLYQFLQLGWASPLLPPWIQTEPCLWWGGLGKVSLSTGEMWSVSQVIYFQIHITEKYNIVICSRISLWVWGPCVFKDKKRQSMFKTWIHLHNAKLFFLRSFNCHIFVITFFSAANYITYLNRHLKRATRVLSHAKIYLIFVDATEYVTFFFLTHKKNRYWGYI